MSVFQPHSKPIIGGIATIPSRKKFFEKKVLPSVLPQVNELHVYLDQDYPEELMSDDKLRFHMDEYLSKGDAGKFIGYNATDIMGDFYYFTFDDDLIYPPDYCERMIDWIEFFGREVVVSLHGSSFKAFPIPSYYRSRLTWFCLVDQPWLERCMFPGTGCMAFHSSIFRPNYGAFKTRNMADIWCGLELQKQKVPAVVIPHSGDYLTYNEELPLEATIWGQENRNDFVQTALVNQFSLDQGFELFPLPFDPSEVESPEPLRSEESRLQSAR